jgi:hypothetical protein
MGGNTPFETRVNSTFFLDIPSRTWTPGANFIMILYNFLGVKQDYVAF